MRTVTDVMKNNDILDEILDENPDMVPDEDQDDYYDDSNDDSADESYNENSDEDSGDDGVPSAPGRGLKRLLRIDPLLFLTVALLNVMGLTALKSICDVAGSDSILVKQAAGSAAGLLIMTAFSMVDCSRVTRYYRILYLIVIASLAAVLVFGTSGGGARRWISLGGLTFQPSELAKILLILFYAEFIIEYVGKHSRIPVYLLSTLLILPPFFMILKEPDLSTGIVVFLVFCVILIVAGLSRKIIAGITAAAIPSFLIMIFLIVSGSLSFLGEYQRNRILAWIHPEEYANSTAYQTMNSITAIGSGQLLGKGLGASGSGTLLGTGFISESQTDFIFAVIGEQFGFAGCCTMIILITAVTVRCYQIASLSTDPRDRIIASGMAAWIGIQSYLNIGVTTGLLPNTGIPLPFVSYGLTSLICLYAGLGFVQNINVRNQEEKILNKRS